MVEASRCTPPTVTDPWSDTYAGYRVRAAALGGLLAALHQGSTMDRAIAHGAETGGCTLAEYLRGLVRPTFPHPITPALYGVNRYHLPQDATKW